jgi:hypothetical protein
MFPQLQKNNHGYDSKIQKYFKKIKKNIKCCLCNKNVSPTEGIIILIFFNF